MTELRSNFTYLHDYRFPCDCSDWHHIRLITDDREEDWGYFEIVSSYEPSGIVDRTKAAIKILFCRPYHNAGVVLNNDNVKDLKEVIDSYLLKNNEKFLMTMTDKSKLDDWEGLYPDGWKAIVEKLYDDIEAISPGHNIFQIKEKFGGLRYYCGVESYDAISNLIAEAEKKSVETCQICGVPGILREDNYWYATLCDEHRKNGLNDD